MDYYTCILHVSRVEKARRSDILYYDAINDVSTVTAAITMMNSQVSAGIHN